LPVLGIAHWSRDRAGELDRSAQEGFGVAHGSNDGYVVEGATLEVILYDLRGVDLAALAAALGQLIGDPNFGPGAEYGGPGSWIFELLIPECREPFELGQWAERTAAVLRGHGAPRQGTVLVASFGREWGVKVYPDEKTEPAPDPAR
jgi:hypothetical protein